MVHVACSVTGLAAGLLCAGGLLFEGTRVAGVGRHGVFGWVDPSYLPYVLYLAVVPGIVGHTGGPAGQAGMAPPTRRPLLHPSRSRLLSLAPIACPQGITFHAVLARRHAPARASPLLPWPGFNTLLKYLDPLVISLPCNLEPLIGSLLGWAAGVVSPPGGLTYAGGALVVASTLVVSYASHMREKRQSALADDARGPGDAEVGAAGEEGQHLMAVDSSGDAAACKGSGSGGGSESSELAAVTPALGGWAAAAAGTPGDVAHPAAGPATALSWGRMDSWSHPERSSAAEGRG